MSFKGSCIKALVTVQFNITQPSKGLGHQVNNLFIIQDNPRNSQSYTVR